MTTILCFLAIKYQLSNTLKITFVLKNWQEDENSRISGDACAKGLYVSYTYSPKNISDMDDTCGKFMNCSKITVIFPCSQL